MKTEKLINFFIALILLSLLPIHVLAKEEEKDDNPCKGLLSLIDRPSLGDSACVTPMEHAILEMGFTTYSLTDGGSAFNYPQSVTRIGLPGKNEFFMFQPTYIQRYNPTESGFTPAAFGIKHQLTLTNKWAVAIEGSVIPPSGGTNFGSRKYGGSANAIMDVLLPANLDITAMFGISSLVESEKSGNGRYNTVNPDLVLSWQPKDNWQYYVEVFGQSKTGTDQGGAILADAGIQYLVNPNFALDVEAGQRIMGELASIKNFIGAGFCVMF